MDWGQFKCLVVSRSMDDDLHSFSMKCLQGLPYDKVQLKGTLPDEYIFKILADYRDKYDWILNIDEDAFVVDTQVLYELFCHMRDNDIDVCGMNDGGNCTPRGDANPFCINPFFNLFYLPGIFKRLCLGSNNSLGIQLNPHELVSKLDFMIFDWSDYILKQLLTSSFRVYQEPYSPILYHLIRDTNILFLYGNSYKFNEDKTKKIGQVCEDDVDTTILYDHKRRPFLYHTWYAREFGNCNSEHHKRIKNVMNIVDVKISSL